VWLGVAHHGDRAHGVIHTMSIVFDGKPVGLPLSEQVTSASDKPRLAGRQPSSAMGCPG
jgi:hypothetical protein